MEFIQTILLALISLSVSGRCFVLRQNETDNVSKIEGGSSICITEVPYQVILKAGGQYFCGGALIEPNVVLTAAHCIYDYLSSPKTLSVVAGTHSTKLYFGHSLFDGSVEIRVEEMKTHPWYTKQSWFASLNYDVGLIKLAKNFPMNDRIQTIDLPKHNVKVNDELLVTGVGLEEADAENISPCLKCYQPKVVDCTQYVSYLQNGEAVICHEDESGNRTHEGDSGGPMVNSINQLVGIHTGTSLKDNYQLAINVYHFLDWIHDTMDEYILNYV